MMDTVMRTVMSTRIVSTTVTMSSVNEDEHCPYTFAQSAPRNCLQIMLTSSGCVAHSAAAVLWPEYAGFPCPGHHRPQAAQFTMTNISRIKLSQLSSLPIVATSHGDGVTGWGGEGYWQWPGARPGVTISCVWWIQCGASLPPGAGQHGGPVGQPWPGIINILMMCTSYIS